MIDYAAIANFIRTFAPHLLAMVLLFIILFVIAWIALRRLTVAAQAYFADDSYTFTGHADDMRNIDTGDEKAPH